MAKLPRPDLDTAGRILQHRERTGNEAPRAHLGASRIGESCERKLWYEFRWASDVHFSGRMLRLFERGHREERVFIEELEAIGCSVIATDHGGEQLSWKQIGGHYAGSADGLALGVHEAPGALHVLEFKTHSDKSFKDLLGKGVELARPTHFDQVQAHLFEFDLKRALYLAVNKNTDALYSERIRRSPPRGKAMHDKALRVVTAPEPLLRLSERPEFYLCKMCDQRSVCHLGRLPRVSCRTCAHATARIDGEGGWWCELDNVSLGIERQRRACKAHVFIPALVPHEISDANQSQNWVDYRLGDGRVVRNGATGVASVELEEALA